MLINLLVRSINLKQVNVLNILYMVNEIFTGESESVGVNEKGDFEIFKEKSDKGKKESSQLDTRDMPEIESEESAAKRRNQQGQGIKVLTKCLVDYQLL